MTTALELVARGRRRRQLELGPGPVCRYCQLRLVDADDVERGRHRPYYCVGVLVEQRDRAREERDRYRRLYEERERSRRNP